MTTIRREGADTAATPANHYDVGAAFDEHAVEWWVYDEGRLVPVPPELAALLSRLHDNSPRPQRRGRWRHAVDRLTLRGARRA